MQKYRKLLSPRTANVAQDASFLRRAGAFLIDLFIIDLFVTAPFTPIFSSLISRTEHANWTSIVYTQRELGAAVLLFLIIYLYFVLFEYLLGQTPGMMLLSTRVDGEYGLPALLVRNSFLFPIFPFIILWIVEPIAISVKRRSVLEFLSKTRTLYQRKIMI